MDSLTFRHLGHLRVQAEALREAGKPVAAEELDHAKIYFECRENEHLRQIYRAIRDERDRCRRAVQACCGDELIERGLLEAIDNDEQWRKRGDGLWWRDNETD